MVTYHSAPSLTAKESYKNFRLHALPCAGCFCLKMVLNGGENMSVKTETTSVSSKDNDKKLIQIEVICMSFIFSIIFLRSIHNHRSCHTPLSAR